jgi:hypothetical protein
LKPPWHQQQTNKKFKGGGGGGELQAHLLTTKIIFEVTYFSIARNTQKQFK